MYREGELRMQVIKYDARGASGGEEGISLALPHSCDQWVIGGPYEATVLVRDLERLIPALQAERTKRGSSGIHVHVPYDECNADE